MMVLDYSIANVSIPYIAGSLAVSTDQGTYVITSFAVGNAIGLALNGWLTSRFGEVRVMTLSILLFTFFSWACGSSWSLEILVINRFLQGLVAGPIVPLSQSLIVKYGTEESRARDLSLWSNIIVAAPVFGPILGGYLSDWYSWVWIFYINIPIGILSAATIWLILKDKESKTASIPIDVWGVFLLCIAVSCLQIFLDKGQQWDWWRSERIWALVIGTIVGFTFLFLRGLGAKNSLMPLRLFKIPSYTLSVIALIISYGMYFGTVVLVPLWLQQYMGYNAEWAGAAVCFLGIAPIFFSWTTPKMMRNWGDIPTFMISVSIFCVGCLYSAFFTTEADFAHIAFSRFLFGFGFICYIAPLQSICVSQIEPDDLPNATGLFHFFRAIMAGVGTSIFTTLWFRRTIFHHERVAEMMTRFNPSTPQSEDPSLQTLLNRGLDQQAAMLALNDVFWLMGWLFLGLVLAMGIYFIWTKKSAKEYKRNYEVTNE